VVLVLGITIAPQTIVTEFCTRGSLYDYLRDKKQKITRDTQVQFLLGIARGMLFLHSESIIHKDLEARNVLLNTNLEPRITNFGLNKGIAEGSNYDVEMIKWMAPEVIQSKTYSTQSDVWAYGVVCAFYVFFFIPFRPCGKLQQDHTLGKKKIHLILQCKYATKIEGWNFLQAVMQTLLK